jgi:hypothetical protein
MTAATTLASASIGLLGGGAMGEALAAGVRAAGVANERLRDANPQPPPPKHIAPPQDVSPNANSRRSASAPPTPSPRAASISPARSACAPAPATPTRRPATWR